jgi:hypothetical protein
MSFNCISLVIVNICKWQRIVFVEYFFLLDDAVCS